MFVPFKFVHFRTEQRTVPNTAWRFSLGALDCMKHTPYCSMICSDLFSIPQENETLQDRLKQADLFYCRIPVLYSIDEDFSEFVPPFATQAMDTLQRELQTKEEKQDISMTSL